jgi:alanine-synthesizing transaminase
MGSMTFAKRLLVEAGVAVSPGIGFGKYGDEYVRIDMIDNENRIRQAARNIKKFIKKIEAEKNKKG